MKNTLKNLTTFLSMSQILCCLVSFISLMKQVADNKFKPISTTFVCVFVLITIIGVCFEWILRKSDKAKIIRRLILIIINIILTVFILHYVII